MSITKRAGNSWGLQGLSITHQGPARTIHVVCTLAPGGGWTHQDPATVMDELHFWAAVSLPDASGGAITTNVGSIDFPWPSPDPFPANSPIDVNLAIGPQRTAGQSFADWFSKRADDDWDDDVYQTGGLPSTESLTVRTGAWY